LLALPDAIAHAHGEGHVPHIERTTRFLASKQLSKLAYSDDSCGDDSRA